MCIRDREFSSGSIRLLLTRPVRRWKVYLGKYLTMVLVSAGLYLAMFLAMVLSSGLQLGFGGFASPVLAFAGGRVVSYNFWACLLYTSFWRETRRMAARRAEKKPRPVRRVRAFSAVSPSARPAGTRAILVGRLVR